MYFGHVINKYRKLNNLTQAELAEKLFVSPQAVSKWEKNQSEPDLETVKKLAEILNISLEQFFKEESVLKDKAVEVNDTSSCSMCGKDFNKDQIYQTQPNVVCKNCQEKLVNEEEQLIKIAAQHKSEVIKKSSNRFTPFIIGGVIFIGLLISAIISYFGSDQNDLGFGEYLISTSVFIILVSTFITQMLYDTWLKEFVGAFIGKTFSMPGVIFELSIDGLIFLIVVKIFLGLLSIIIGLIIFGFGLLLALLIAPFTFVYQLIKNIKEHKNAV